MAVLTLVEAGHFCLDDPFLPLVPGGPSAHPLTAAVTIRHLLQMRSGLLPDDELDPDAGLVSYLREYLRHEPVAGPGASYAYSNANFTILQAVVETVSGCEYADYVTEAVLTPMGVDTRVLNPVPDSEHTATLGYGGEADTAPGQHWPFIGLVGAGGWVGSAMELLKFLHGVRRSIVLSPSMTGQMFAGELGWYTHRGAYSEYHYHDGELVNDTGQWIKTAMVYTPSGHDAVLLVNSPIDPAELIIHAFESSGLVQKTQ